MLAKDQQTEVQHWLDGGKEEAKKKSAIKVISEYLKSEI